MANCVEEPRDVTDDDVLKAEALLRKLQAKKKKQQQQQQQQQVVKAKAKAKAKAPTPEAPTAAPEAPAAPEAETPNLTTTERSSGHPPAAEAAGTVAELRSAAPPAAEAAGTVAELRSAAPPAAEAAGTVAERSSAADTSPSPAPSTTTTTTTTTGTTAATTPMANEPYYKSKVVKTNERYATRTVDPGKFHLSPAAGSTTTTIEDENGQPLILQPLRQDEQKIPILQTVAKKASKMNPPPSVPTNSLDHEQRVASQCKHCLKKFSRVSFYQKHVNSSSCFLSKRNEGFWCSFCSRYFATEKDKLAHERWHLRNRSSRSTVGEKEGEEEQLGGNNFENPMLRVRDRHGCKVYVRNFEEGEIRGIEAAFMRLRNEIVEKVTTDLRLHKIIKFGVVTVGSFAKLDEDGNILSRSEIPMRVPFFRLFLSDERRIKMYVNRIQKKTLERLEEIEETGSGHTIIGVSKVYLEVGKCNLIGGKKKNPRDDLKIPYGKEFLIDVDAMDELCFANAFAQHFLEDGNRSLASTQDWICSNLKLDGIPFPMDLQKIAMFERRHASLETGINVFMVEGKKCYPVHKSVRKSVTNCANILLVPYIHNKEKAYHYVYIKDLDSFLSRYQSQLGTKRNDDKKHCVNCLSAFSSSESLEEHQLICLKNEAQLITIPEEGKKLKFRNHLKSFGHEFIGFADFESRLVPYERRNNVKCQNCQELGDISLCKHETSVLNEQVATCYSLVFVDREKNIVFQRTEVAEDAMPLFFKALEDAQELLLPQLQAAKSQMVWLDEDEVRYKTATVCHICKEPFESVRDKVKDHCHRSGKWLGAAHYQCNVDRRVKTKLLCYMHNFSGYDSHFVMKHYMELQGREKRVKGLAMNGQKFRTVTLGKVEFVDSLHLLDASLSELVNDLVEENHPFPILKASGIYNTEQQRELLIRSKGVYPYEYITSFETLSEKQLPPRENFFSVLRDDGISEEDYEHALKTFKAFKCKDLGDYTRLYCHLDTLQLAEIMLEFMSEVEKDFELCSTNYISLPQLSFDAMLKSTGVELDYIPDQEMTLLFENSIRGGVSYVNSRLVDVAKEGGIIEYYDANNLYGKAQMEYLPMGNYRWLSEKEIEEQFQNLDALMKKSKNDPKGWVLEVDLHYPKKLRKTKKHQNMPLAPEHLEIFHCDLSQYSKECLAATTGKKNNKRYHSSKLCGTFYDKKRYLVHYRNLQFYLKHGLKLEKIHRVIEFDQGAFSKPYIEFTAKKRATTKSNFKKRMAKLLANANFGKWLQNVRKYVDVKICTREAIVTKYINSPRYIESRQIGEDLTAVFLKKKKVVMDRKYSIGFTILEISKLIMYEYWYETIVPRFGEENVDILLSDTDSFVLHIRNHTREQAKEKMSDVMDYSNLSKGDPFYDASRAKVPGYLKSETPTSEIVECVALKSKCYALRSRPLSPSSLSGEEEVEKKCKGITKSRVKKLKIDSYRECIERMAVIKTRIARLQSKNHNVQTITQNKVSLSSFCDKRYLLQCGRHSRPYQREPQSDICQICM